MAEPNMPLSVEPRSSLAAASPLPAGAEKKRSKLETVLHYLTFGLEGAPRETVGGDAAYVSRVDGPREIVETVVFVVVLVLLLKSFVAEAFVIPTGSMAETLWGYQKVITCDKCGKQFPVNCSQEVDPPEGFRQAVETCICPNCRWVKTDMTRTVEVEGRDRTGARFVETRKVPRFESHTGDRVLVAKFLYDLPWRSPERLDTVVFKYPKEPQKNFTAMNYIKRLVGLGGETIVIHMGNLYVLPKEKSPQYDDRHVDPLDLWQKENMHQDDPRALELFEKGAFEIMRKPPEKILSMRRLVYDNDHQAKDLKDTPRWTGQPDDAGSWKPLDDAKAFEFTPAGNAGLGWLRYRHLLRGGQGRPELITDFMGYNTGQGQLPNEHWVGDLLLECDAQVTGKDGRLVLELSRGTDRFRAIFDVATGMCTLRQIKKHLAAFTPAEDAGEELRSAPTALKGPGTYRLRFANVDDRLTVWVNNKLPFGDGVAYTPSDQPGPYENDLQPASIGVNGTAVRVSGLRLFRDTYYTPPPDDRGDVYFSDWADPAKWSELRSLPARSFYVQPGHYLCMGDNSPQSSDGRSWGTVPERLMLGRALAVYFPFKFPWWPLESPVNRIGPIR